MPHTNPHENTSEGGPDVPEYEELSNVISLDGIRFMPHTYLDEELNVLQPRLMALGYTEIVWSMGDRDSWGPITRICTARDAVGEIRSFIYG